MTDNEIIQAWELCMSGKEEACNDCPYFTTGCIDDLHNDTYAFIKRQQDEIERLQNRLEEKQATSDKTSEWISVKDRLPNEEWEKIQREKDWDIYPCLCSVKNHISKERYTAELFYDGKHFMDDEFVRYTDSVTHWMPMPEPPKGD